MMIDDGCELFERLCSKLDLRRERVAEAGDRGEERPDYRVVGTDGSTFVAEVKLVTPSDEESEEFRRIAAGEFLATGGEPGARMRRFIQKANRQLRALGEEVPCVIVVFNPDWRLRRHTDPYAILTAMRGLDVIDVEVPSDRSQQPRFGPVRSGPKKRMTATESTTTSAIICAGDPSDDEWHVAIYHNRHAARPLPAGALVGDGVSHWRMSDDERTWVPLVEDREA